MARQILDSVKAVLEFKERLKREEDAAYKFFVEHKDTFCSPENLGTASQIIRKQLELNTLKNERCAAIFRKAEEKRRHEELEHERKLRELKRIFPDTDRHQPLDLMRPVTPEVRNTLYEGISATGGGRQVQFDFKKMTFETMPMEHLCELCKVLVTPGPFDRFFNQNHEQIVAKKA